MKKHVGIIGGGAAGMVAAIAAARNGAKVTICEAGDRLGQKILSTGNGKCNLGNLRLDPKQYHGSCQFLDEAFRRFGIDETISFFEKLGVMLKERDGYVYPRTEQASTVLDALRFEIKSLGIRVLNHFHAEEILPNGKAGWKVRSDSSTEIFDAVILASGGEAMPKTGSDGSGYKLAQMLGHKLIPVVPALTFVKCNENYFKSISGVRMEAAVTLLSKDNQLLCRERGEIQFTDTGLSGIPVFQMSRVVANELRNRKEVTISIDLLPEVIAKKKENEEDTGAADKLSERYQAISKLTMDEFVYGRRKLLKDRTVEECFNGIFPKKIMAFLVKSVGLKLSDPAERLTEEEIRKVFQRARTWKVSVTDTGSWQNCQVCAGGVDCSLVSDCFESKIKKGIFFAGEILDVDGRCGGYNLQWAWTSGYIAGQAAAERR